MSDTEIVQNIKKFAGLSQSDLINPVAAPYSYFSVHEPLTSDDQFQIGLVKLYDTDPKKAAVVEDIIIEDHKEYETYTNTGGENAVSVKSGRGVLRYTLVVRFPSVESINEKFRMILSHYKMGPYISIRSPYLFKASLMQKVPSDSIKSYLLDPKYNLSDIRTNIASYIRAQLNHALGGLYTTSAVSISNIIDAAVYTAVARALQDPRSSLKYLNAAVREVLSETSKLPEFSKSEKEKIKNTNIGNNFITSEFIKSVQSAAESINLDILDKARVSSNNVDPAQAIPVNLERVSYRTDDEPGAIVAEITMSIFNHVAYVPDMLWKDIDGNGTKDMEQAAWYNKYMIDKFYAKDFEPTRLEPFTLQSGRASAGVSTTGLLSIERNSHPSVKRRDGIGKLPSEDYDQQSLTIYYPVNAYTSSITRMEPPLERLDLVTPDGLNMLKSVSVSAIKGLVFQPVQFGGYATTQYPGGDQVLYDLDIMVSNESLPYVNRLKAQLDLIGQAPKDNRKGNIYPIIHNPILNMLGSEYFSILSVIVKPVDAEFSYLKLNIMDVTPKAPTRLCYSDKPVSKSSIASNSVAGYLKEKLASSNYLLDEVINDFVEFGVFIASTEFPLSLDFVGIPKDKIPGRIVLSKTGNPVIYLRLIDDVKSRLSRIRNVINTTHYLDKLDDTEGDSNLTLLSKVVTRILAERIRTENLSDFVEWSNSKPVSGEIVRRTIDRAKDNLNQIAYDPERNKYVPPNFVGARDVQGIDVYSHLPLPRYSDLFGMSSVDMLGADKETYIWLSKFLPSFSTLGELPPYGVSYLTFARNLEDIVEPDFWWYDWSNSETSTQQMKNRVAAAVHSGIGYATPNALDFSKDEEIKVDLLEIIDGDTVMVSLKDEIPHVYRNYSIRAGDVIVVRLRGVDAPEAFINGEPLPFSGGTIRSAFYAADYATALCDKLNVNVDDLIDCITLDVPEDYLGSRYNKNKVIARKSSSGPAPSNYRLKTPKEVYLTKADVITVGDRLVGNISLDPINSSEKKNTDVQVSIGEEKVKSSIINSTAEVHRMAYAFPGVSLKFIWEGAIAKELTPDEELLLTKGKNGEYSGFAQVRDVEAIRRETRAHPFRANVFVDAPIHSVKILQRAKKIKVAEILIPGMVESFVNSRFYIFPQDENYDYISGIPGLHESEISTIVERYRHKNLVAQDPSPHLTPVGKRILKLANEDPSWLRNVVFSNGTRITIRIGYTTKVSSMPVRFTGTIGESNLFDTIHLVAQSYDAQLLNAYRSKFRPDGEKDALVEILSKTFNGLNQQGGTKYLGGLLNDPLNVIKLTSDQFNNIASIGDGIRQEIVETPEGFNSESTIVIDNRQSDRIIGNSDSSYAPLSTSEYSIWSHIGSGLTRPASATWKGLLEFWGEASLYHGELANCNVPTVGRGSQITNFFGRIVGLGNTIESGGRTFHDILDEIIKWYPDTIWYFDYFDDECRLFIGRPEQEQYITSNFNYADYIKFRTKERDYLKRIKRDTSLDLYTITKDVYDACIKKDGSSGLFHPLTIKYNLIQKPLLPERFYSYAEFSEKIKSVFGTDLLAVDFLISVLLKYDPPKRPDGSPLHANIWDGDVFSNDLYTTQVIPVASALLTDKQLSNFYYGPGGVFWLLAKEDNLNGKKELDFETFIEEALALQASITKERAGFSVELVGHTIAFLCRAIEVFVEGRWQAKSNVSQQDYSEFNYYLNSYGDYKRPFRTRHIATSTHGIVENDIRVSESNMFNQVTMSWSPTWTTGSFWHDLFGLDKSEIYVGVDASPDQTRRVSIANPHVRDKNTAVNVARSYLAEGMSRSYTGTLTLRGAPIKPFDVVHINDLYNGVYGPVEVDEVVESIDITSGYLSTVYPKMLVRALSVNEAAYTHTGNSTALALGLIGAGAIGLSVVGLLLAPVTFGASFAATSAFIATGATGAALLAGGQTIADLNAEFGDKGYGDLSYGAAKYKSVLASKFPTGYGVLNTPVSNEVNSIVGSRLGLEIFPLTKSNLYTPPTPMLAGTKASLQIDWSKLDIGGIVSNWWSAYFHNMQVGYLDRIKDVEAREKLMAAARAKVSRELGTFAVR